jgi:hypothetical protein
MANSDFNQARLMFDYAEEASKKLPDAPLAAADLKRMYLLLAAGLHRVADGLQTLEETIDNLERVHGAYLRAIDAKVGEIERKQNR